MEPVEPIESADPTEAMLRQLATDQREPVEYLSQALGATVTTRPLP